MGKAGCPKKQPLKNHLRRQQPSNPLNITVLQSVSGLDPNSWDSDETAITSAPIRLFSKSKESTMPHQPNTTSEKELFTFTKPPLRNKEPNSELFGDVSDEPMEVKEQLLPASLQTFLPKPWEPQCESCFTHILIK